VAGCSRVTWNGQQGEQCCRTCQQSSGASHGADCEAKSRAAAAMSPTCNVAGCSRVTWNGEQGEQCCRACQQSSGASHGVVCEAKARTTLASGGGQKGRSRSAASPFPGAPDRSHWHSNGQLQKKLFPVDQGSDEYTFVKDLFMQTMPSQVCIDQIERVENDAQHVAFAQQKKAVAEESGMDEKDIVQLLFHGTSEQSIRDIVHSVAGGFEPLAAGTSTGAKWGDGSYFARDASLSAGYTSELSSGNRQMLLNEVVVGLSTKGKKGTKAYPKVPGAGNESMRYHSLVDDEDSPSIYVVPRSTAAYPAFLITYH